MPFPSYDQYNEAVQTPTAAFPGDGELQKARFRTNSYGIPIALGGGFALTYEATNGHHYAVRCFHKDVPDIHERYAKIDAVLRQLRSPYFVDFTFKQRGMRVGNQVVPIVKMQWVTGETLGVYVENRSRDIVALRNLKQGFRTLAQYLRQNRIAHGDLQTGNVIISGNSIKLIDYDGLYVPSMALGAGNEVGHVHFQHGGRRGKHFGPEMDRFSLITICLSLEIIATRHALFQQYFGGENLIFTGQDFADPQNSRLFGALLKDPVLKTSAEHFARICDADYSQIPTLEEFLAGQQIPTRAVPPPELVRPPPRVYVGPYPVLAATDYQAIVASVGQRVEVVGKIVEVKRDRTRGYRSRGYYVNGRPYVFVNFGNWRENIFQVTIWDAGLARMPAPPDRGWQNSCVSVTGLVDPVYHGTYRHGQYAHVSITLNDPTQIQRITEEEAGFRLGAPFRAGGQAAPAGPPPPRGGAPAGPGHQTPPRHKTRNQEVLDRLRGQAAAVGQGTGQPPPGPTSGRGCLVSAAAFIGLYLLAKLLS